MDADMMRTQYCTKHFGPLGFLLAACYLLLATAPLSAQGSANVFVFGEFDADGVQDLVALSLPAQESGVADVAVSVYRDDTNGDLSDDLVGSGTTDATGNAMISPLTVPDGTAIRIEVGLPMLFAPGPFGADSATTVIHTTAGATVRKVGLQLPISFVPYPANLMASCFVFENQVTGPNRDLPVLVSYAENAGSNSTVTPGLYDITKVIQATAKEVGSVGGFECRVQADGDPQCFVASFVKRHTGLGPSDNPTTIYSCELDGTNPLDDCLGGWSVWLTRDGTRPDPHSGDTDGWVRDFAAFSKVFKEGLGDLKIWNGQVLTIDLATRELLKIPVLPNGAAGTPTAVDIIAGITPAVMGQCTDDSSVFAPGDLRPFGLGIHPLTNKVYVGVVCSGQSTVDETTELPIEGTRATPTNTFFVNRPGDRNKLRGYVFEWDGVTTFTQVLSFPLTYARGCGDANDSAFCLNSFNGGWVPWVDKYPFYNRQTGAMDFHLAVYPQPAITDLQFLDNGDLVLFLGDRWGHQTGPGTNTPAYPLNPSGGEGQLRTSISTGDVLRACASGSSWIMEELISGNPSCGTAGTSSHVNSTVTIDEYYYQDGYSNILARHSEVAFTSGLQLPGRTQTIVAAFDPLFPIDNQLHDGGFIFLNNTTGAWEFAQRLYNKASANPPIVDFYGKAAGLWGPRAIRREPPLEIGNYVFIDANINGVQDPSESPLPNVDVTLVCPGPGINVTTLTNAQGQYYFNAGNVTGGIPPNTACELRINLADPDLGGRTPTLISGGTNDLHDSDFSVTGTQVVVAFTTGNLGASNHTFDAGFFTPGEFDYGDLPVSYDTLFADDGPRHVLGSGIFLGSVVDDETNGQPDPGAAGDDTASDDEDGVSFLSPPFPGGTVMLEVVASAPCLLSAWFDFDADGVFNLPRDQIFTNQLLSAGINALSFAVPGDASQADTYTRFRCSSNPNLLPWGVAADGEVEDYAVTTVPVELMSFSIE